jgi:hypothetical protein
VGAALQRKIYLEWGHEKIYPNMYVILIGPSGKCRKGTAMTIGMHILKEIGVQMTSEATTREALIRRMGESPQSYTDETDGAIKFHCSLTCFNEELSVFLGQNDTRFLGDLTNWYDSRDEWTYETKGAGTDKIQGVCFTLLGATAPDWIPTMFPQEAVGGGFTSRCIFVVEEDKAKTIPLYVMSDEDRELRAAIVRDLERIHNTTGAVYLDDEATRRYSDWYRGEEENIRMGKLPIEDPRFAGYVDRRATHVRKLSMIMMASRGGIRVIEKQDVDRAISTLISTEKKMPKAFGALGRSQYAEAVEAVLNLVKTKKQISRSALMKLLYRDVDSQTLRVVEEVLTHMKVVQITLRPQDHDAIYTWKGGI